MQIHVHVHVLYVCETCMSCHGYNVSPSECRDGIRSILTDSTHKKMSRDNALKDLMASASQKLSLQRRAKPSLSSRISSSLWSLCGQRLQTALRHLMPSISEKLSLQRTAKPSLSRPHFSLINSSFWSLCAQELQTLALDSGLR